jgi:cold shock CspA family protein
MTSNIGYSVGTVDWFGGENNKTGRKNDFGFITCHNFTSVYVHKNEIQQEHLKKGDIVAFKITKDEKEKKSAKYVVNVKQTEPRFAEMIVNLLLSDSEIKNIINKSKYKEVIVKSLEYSFGLEITNELKGEARSIPFLMELMQDCSNKEKLFKKLVEGLTVHDIYASSIQARYIPNSFFLENHLEIFEWWKSVEDLSIKSDILVSAIPHLSRPNKLYKRLEDALTDQELHSIFNIIKSQLGILPILVELLGVKAKDKDFFKYYISEVHIDELLSGKLPLKFLPINLVKKIIIEKLSDINKTKSHTEFDSRFLSLLLRSEFVNYAMENVTLETRDALIQAFAIEFPLNKEFLRSVKKTEKYLDIFEKYSNGITLENYLEQGISTELPSSYVKKQLNKHLESLTPRKHEKSSKVSKSVICFALKSRALRSSTTKELRKPPLPA